MVHKLNHNQAMVLVQGQPMMQLLRLMHLLPTAFLLAMGGNLLLMELRNLHMVLNHLLMVLSHLHMALNLLHMAPNLLHMAHKGTNSKIKQKDVEAAKVVGMGCFMIYKGKGFSGPSVKIEGASPLSLKAEGHTWTTVKSVLYSSNCNFSRQAGAEVYVIAAVVAVVFLVAIVALAWSRFRRRTHSQVPVDDAA